MITAGSIAGLGNYYLGGNELAVGGNNQSTAVGGEIHDGRSDDRNRASPVDAGSGATLLKLGTGTLTLSGDNTFSGGLRLGAGTVELAVIRAAGLGEVIFGEGAQTLRITNAALLDHVFANEVGWIGPGDVIDLNGLAFKPGAAATYDAATHVLTVAGGGGVTDVLTLADPMGTHFAALGDHTGGTRVMLAIVGSAGADTVDAVHHPLGQASPTGDSDVIQGLGGNDVLKGLGGADILGGGLGRDTLYGGYGHDCFVFQRLADSTAGARDTIMDFSHAQGDKIDLYDLDADTRKAGNQAFVFIGGDTFAHYHALHHSVIGMVRFAGGVLQGNVNASLAADFAIAVHGPAALHAGDFIL
jgi:autotransporter-associated beta strand protein